ncbi:MAG: hypothetical protein LQ344_005947 [Seirophora lacunosa]|nr:MAG: hypothetical protein LQ344_005947 [Seirophora lacunosa]
MSSSAKNSLTYEPKEPAFLRKLKSEYEGSNSARHQGSLARPKRQKDAGGEDEDEPVFVHETDPNVPISKADYEALLDASTKKQEPAEEAQRERSGGRALDMKAPLSAPSVGEGVLQDAEPLAGIGAASRKRAVKVVGGSTSATGVPECGGRSEAKRKQRLKKVKRPRLSFQYD